MLTKFNKIDNRTFITTRLSLQIPLHFTWLDSPAPQIESLEQNAVWCYIVSHFIVTLSQ